MIYILQHTITFEIMAAFTDKELAEKWANVINYTKLVEIEITH
jgi:hypothetical protein